MSLHPDFFSCLFCGESLLNITSENWVCLGCNHSYPVINNIPVLVKDWQSHNLELEKLSAIKPDWYQTEQDPEESSPWRHNHRKRRQYVESYIRNWLNKKEIEKVDHLLDLGCGDGNHLSYLEKFGRNIFGSDYNLVRLVRSSSRFPEATFFLADLLDYPAKQGFFDIIFFNHVIEHITDDCKALENIYRMLKPGGLIILGTPNEGAFWWQLAYYIQPSMRQQTDHVQFYTAESLVQKMELAGFNIIEIEHIGWGPPHFTLDSKIRRYKLVDDVFETLGRQFFPKQASSLYILATKKE